MTSLSPMTNMTKIFLRFSGAALALAFASVGAGCSSPYHKEFTRSTQETGQTTVIHGFRVVSAPDGFRVVETPDIALHFKPDNEVRNNYRCMYFVLPIPVPVKVVTDNTPKQLGYKNFSVLMAIKPHRDGFALDPRSVQLLINNTVVRASGMVGPQSSSKACYGLSHAEGSRFEKLTRIEHNGVWSCYSAFFDIPPPSPDTPIALRISGMMLDGGPYKLPEIAFKRTAYSYDGNSGECGCACSE